ncbi:Uncharacterized protein APZ42_006483 [Daphnia magna]|uniref:Uncharacterized protein n=1 Tax=Daphnia magna TaxID=35525 RepID=A0A164FVH9_9CRUS|nr:Uncharacterized protein APZ42_006483 [Daphnia magna]
MLQPCTYLASGKVAFVITFLLGGVAVVYYRTNQFKQNANTTNTQLLSLLTDPTLVSARVF